MLGFLSATLGSISAAGASPSTAAASYPSVLTAGQTIEAGSILVSPDGFVSLRMQSDGNLVLVAGGHVLWNARTHGGGNFAQLDRSGAFTVYSPGRRALWTTRTSGFSPALSVGDDGNLALQTPNGTILWTPNSRATELDGANYLNSGQFLTDQREDRLTQQSDGNLVVRRANGVVRWNTGSQGPPGTFTVLQRDGNLVTYAPNGRVLWNSGTAVPGASLSIDPTGILLLRRPDGSVEWTSNPPAPPVAPISVPQTAADYASAILTMWGGKVTGLAGAYSDLLATSRGQTITNSDSCGNTVRVDIRIVAFLYHVTSQYKILINNIITGHGCDAEHHPKGEATDLGGAWNLATGAVTSFGGYWGANDTSMDAQFASYASTILPVGSGLGQSTCPGTSSAQLSPGIVFFPDSCNHQHIQV